LFRHNYLIAGNYNDYSGKNSKTKGMEMAMKPG